jgi:hypothetical protein
MRKLPIPRSYFQHIYDIRTPVGNSNLPTQKRVVPKDTLLHIRRSKNLRTNIYHFFFRKVGYKQYDVPWLVQQTDFTIVYEDSRASMRRNEISADRAEQVAE